MPRQPRLLTIMAHPDDAESYCGGTLALLADRGWRIRVGLLTGGEYGTVSASCEETRETRLRESEIGAKIMGADLAWVGIHDLEVVYSPENLKLTVDLLRDFKPDIVLTTSPECYHVDHQEAARLAWVACFAAGAPKLETKLPPLDTPIPHLYYCEPTHGIDRYGNPIIGSLHIDIEEGFERRQQAFASHESQSAWLDAHHGSGSLLDSNRHSAERIGKLCGVKYAESFRQHLTEPFPTDNLLADVLAPYVKQLV